MDALKRCLKKLLQDKFEIEHSTLEFENNTCSSHSDPKGAVRLN